MKTRHEDETCRRLNGTVYATRFEGYLPAAFARHLRPAGGRAHRRGVAVTYRSVPRRELLAEADELAVESGEETAPGGFTWQSEPGDPGTLGRFTLTGRREHFRLAAWGPQQGLFDCRPGSIDLTWTGGGASLAAHHFFAYAVPLWLETRGIPVLHGSAVTLGGRAVGFLGASGTGKSVLCAELVRRGAGFLADDGLALEPIAGAGAGAWGCLAGPPLLRLWPSGLARRLELSPDELPKIRPEGDKRSLTLSLLGAGDPEVASGGDTSGDEPRPAPSLAAVYLLRRRPEAGGGVELSPLSLRDSLFRLVEHGVAAAPAAALGLEESRLQTLALVAEDVPMRELSFPTGNDTAAAVGDALERDLQGLGAL